MSDTLYYLIRKNGCDMHEIKSEKEARNKLKEIVENNINSGDTFQLVEVFMDEEEIEEIET